jgi:nucleoid DNA-binding protein
MVAMKVMKAMKKKAVSSKSLSKTGIADALATKSGLKKSEVSKLLDTFTDLATAEVKKAGKFTIPGLCMLKSRIKPARKAGTRLAFGKTIKVSAAPAKKIVKAFCVSALKKSI